MKGILCNEEKSGVFKDYNKILMMWRERQDKYFQMNKNKGRKRLTIWVEGQK